MTYFKYVKREAPQQVNWAEIGNDISTTLIAERDRREALKEQIDADTREIGKKFEEAPMGQSQTLNDWTLEGANSASQLMLQMEREMKAGRLDYKDYIKFRQNISDGVDNLYNVVKDYNTEFDRKLERAKTGQSSKVESYLMEQVEGFQNFSETGVYWDPMNGTAAIAKKQRDEEGNLTSAISDDPNDFASVQSLQSRIKKDYDRYDVEGNMATISESVGEELLVIREKGIATQADAMQKEAWQKAEDDLVGSVLTSPDNAVSVLLDYAEQNPDGKEYFITFSEEEANKDASAVLMKTDNNGNVYASFDHPNGKKQMKEAKEALKANLRIKLDRKQTMLEESSRVPTEAEYKRMDGLAKEVSLANSLGKFYYGAEEEIASASGFIQGLEGNEDIIKVQRTPEALVVTRRVGEEGSREVRTEEFPFVVTGTDGKPRQLSQEDWIASVYTELTPGQNLDGAVANSAYRADREFNPYSRRSFDVNIRPDVQPLGDLQFEIGKDKLAFSDLFTVAEDSDADELDIAVQDTERVLQQLPDQLTNGSSYRVLNDDELDDVAGSGAEDAVVIDMPSVLTAPIIVPRSEQFSAKMRSLVADLYKSAAEGKRRAPASYKNFFDAGEFDKYNNENSAALYEYPEEALTGEVYSQAGTEATATDEFRVIDIEELPENNQPPAEVPSFDATPEGATPANEVDAAEEVSEVDAAVDAFLDELEPDTAVADTAMAETATVPVDTEERNPLVTSVEEEAPIDDAKEADLRMVTNLFEDKKNSLSWPTPTTEVLKPFDANTKGAEFNGMEIAAETNTAIKPSFPGVVTKVMDLPTGGGKAVIVSHGDYRTVYSKLRTAEVREGDEVTAEGVIGYPFGDSLNFQVWKVEGDSVRPQNPQEWLTSE